jgi:nucleotidyltransferase substrate binding protein (TIGR01987 family)
LDEVARIPSPTKIERDAAIQRFEYTFEACWKATQRFLLVVEGLETGSPKGAIRLSREVGLLSDEETVQALEMVDDRNQTVHTYNESLAVQIAKRLPGYAELLGHWLRRMQQRS